MQYTYWEFFPLLKTAFELVRFDALSASAFFALPHLFHTGIPFPFGDFFHLRKQKKSLRVKSGE